MYICIFFIDCRYTTKGDEYNNINNNDKSKVLQNRYY